MKFYNVIILLISFNLFSQFEYGVKGGINFNSNINLNAEIESIDNAINIFESLGNFFIRPELTYSKIKNSYNIPYVLVKTENIVTEFSQNKIDIPVMLGYKFYNLINIFAGPRFEYIEKVEFESLKIDDLKNKFKTGLQYGIGVKFGNIEVDVRAERSFTKNEIKFMENQIGEKNQYISTQGKLYLLGVSYYF